MACQGRALSETDALSADASTPPAALENETLPSTAAEVVSGDNEIEPHLTKDMAYADLRNAALETGWTPVVNPECKKNVGGEARICEQVPELESCSGDGYCLMKFRKASTGRHFNVTTYGMQGDWNVPGADSRLNVIEWEFTQ